MTDYDRLLETAMREFARGAESQVERAFERALQLGEEIPWIGDAFPPPQYRDDLKQVVIRALCARKWFEFEAPRWAQPLPLKLDDCQPAESPACARRTVRHPVAGEALGPAVGTTV
jgi:hypothetical protein